MSFGGRGAGSKVYPDAYKLRMNQQLAIPMQSVSVPEYMPPKGVAKAVKQALGLPVIAVGRAMDQHGRILYAMVKVA